MASTVADQIVQHLKAAGVQFIFGHPGGGSITDLIEAANRHGLRFVLAHTETAAAFMAASQAEISGKPGVCMATLGPGAAALTGGVAHAHLDRLPLLVFTDAHPLAVAELMEHQTLNQQALFASITRLSTRLDVHNAHQIIQQAIHKTQTGIPGPVHLDVAAEVTGSEATFTDAAEVPSSPAILEINPELKSLLEKARRPVFLLGLGSRTRATARTIRALSEEFGIPALVTYKAKGVMPDHHLWYAGVVTHGALEKPVLERADLFIGVGFDPVELLTRPWNYPQPFVSITPWAMQQKQLPLQAELVGNCSEILSKLKRMFSHSDWRPGEIAGLIGDQRRAMRVKGEGQGIAPYRVVEIAADVYAGSRATVDAGAHMFPTMALWPAQKPHDMLISNGLATMGFALPAAIGSVLLERQPTLAFTGDGGLLMCVSELQTAAREGLPIRVIVFADGALSLIKIKQLARGYPTDGVHLGNVDWVGLGTALGVKSLLAQNEEELKQYLQESHNHPGPVLIAAIVDPTPYQATIKALRG